VDGYWFQPRVLLYDDLVRVVEEAKKLQFDLRLSARALRGLESHRYGNFLMVSYGLKSRAHGRVVDPYIEGALFIKTGFFLESRYPFETIPMDIPIDIFPGLPKLSECREFGKGVWIPFVEDLLDWTDWDTPDGPVQIDEADPQADQALRLWNSKLRLWNELETHRIAARDRKSRG
jgi:hypothetical protein